MNTTDTHAVGSLRVELSVARDEWARPWMDGLFDLWREHLAADTEKIFQAECPPERCWVAERLELDLGTIHGGHFFEEFRTRFCTALRTQLQQQIAWHRPGTDGEVSACGETTLEHALEMLIHALLHGTAPWSAPADWEMENVFDRLLETHRPATLRVIGLAGREERVRVRLVRWLDDPRLARLTRALVPSEGDFLVHYAEALQQRHREEAVVSERAETLRDVTWELILAHVLANRGSRFNAKAFLRGQIQGLAARFNLSFSDLLEKLVRPLNPPNREGVGVRDDSLRRLLEELATEESETRFAHLERQLEEEPDGADPREAKTEVADGVRWSQARDLAVLRHLLERGDWPADTPVKLFGLRPVSWIHALVATLSTDRLRRELSAWARQGQIQRGLPEFFDDDLIGLVLTAVAPEAAPTAIAWVEQALILQRRWPIASGVSAQNLRAALWETVLGLFFTEPRRSWTAREIVERISRHVAGRFALDAAVVGNFFDAVSVKGHDRASTEFEGDSWKEFLDTRASSSDLRARQADLAATEVALGRAGEAAESLGSDETHERLVLRHLFETGRWPSGSRVKRSDSPRLILWIRKTLTVRTDRWRRELAEWAQEEGVLGGLPAFFDDEVIGEVISAVAPAHAPKGVTWIRGVMGNVRRFPFAAGALATTFRSNLWEAVLSFFLLEPSSVFSERRLAEHVRDRLAQRFRRAPAEMTKFFAATCAGLPSSPMVAVWRELAEAIRPADTRTAASISDSAVTTSDPARGEALDANWDEISAVTAGARLARMQAFWELLENERGPLSAELQARLFEVWATGRPEETAAYRMLVARSWLTAEALDRLRAGIGAAWFATIFFGRDRRALDAWEKWIHLHREKIPGGSEALLQALWRSGAFTSEMVTYILQTGGEVWLAAALFAERAGGGGEWLSWLAWLRTHPGAQRRGTDTPLFATGLWRDLVDLRTASHGRMELGLGLAAVVALLLHRRGVRFEALHQLESEEGNERGRPWRRLLRALQGELAGDPSPLARTLGRSVARSLRATGGGSEFAAAKNAAVVPPHSALDSSRANADEADAMSFPPDVTTAMSSADSLPMAPVGKRPPTATDDSASTSLDPLFLHNAGLILLAPFFPVLFARTGLTDRGGFRDPAAMQRAVHLTQLILSEDRRARDYSLALNKVLCGLEPASPVVSAVTFTPEERTVVGELLSTALAQWKGLGQVSVEGFKNSFLWRAGRLTRREDRWELVVERRGWDVLLQSLPWGFTLIKPSWMPLPLHTSWA